MKKLLLLFSALVIFVSPKISAQLINPDFETWSQNSVAPAGVKDPNNGNGSSGWWDFNFTNSVLLGSSPVTVFQDSVNPSPNHGKYYAAIVSKAMSNAAYTTLKSYGFPYSDTNGAILSAYVDIVEGFPPTATFKPGVPFTTKIGSYSFYYRYIPNGTDTCSCSIGLFHWYTNKSVYIGGGYWSNSATKTGWTQATVNITYDSMQVAPDTIIIQFSACSIYSKSNPKPGDTMDVDNGSDVPLGIDNISIEHDNVTLYPNPASTSINLAVTGLYKANRVEIYDIAGKAIGTYAMRNNILTINTEAYNSGLYFYKLLDDNGIQLNVGKFSVVK